jgi:hypothetical protein
MGNRHDDRSSRRGTRNDEPGRPYDRDQDMGGSRWSGASGRGGYGPEPTMGYPDYPREGAYPGDRRHGQFSGGGASPEGRHEDHEEGSFLREDSPGHVPNQRWSGGYGGDRDRDLERAGWEASGPPSGRGFTGNDFGGLPRRRDRAYGAPVDVGPRHFGSNVDRGGRMGLGGGESTTGRGYWSWESDRAGGVNMGQMGGREGWNRETGYGFQGTDMGMGAPPDEDRGPHYGKGPKGYKRSDERTLEDVCDAIAHQGHIDASDVEVKVEGGTVTLSGTVMHRQDKRGLEHIAERCRGVREVHNELRLKRAEAGQQQQQQAQKQQQPQQQGRPQDKPTDAGDGSTNRGHQNGKTARS